MKKTYVVLSLTRKKRENVFKNNAYLFHLFNGKKSLKKD